MIVNVKLHPREVPVLKEAQITSRSSIAVDLILRGKNGTGSYGVSILNELDRVLNELLILRDSKEMQPETQLNNFSSVKRIHAFQSCTKNVRDLITDDLNRIEWASKQVRNVQKGDMTSARELCQYLTKLSGILLAIE